MAKKEKQDIAPETKTAEAVVDVAAKTLVRVAKMIAKANGEGPIVVRQKLAGHCNYDAICGAIDAGDLRAAVELFEIDAKTGNVPADQTTNAG